MTPRRPQTEQERETLLGLWAVPGMGPQSLNILRSKVRDGDLGALYEVRPTEWAEEVGLSRPLQERLLTAASPAEIAPRVRERCEAARIGIAFVGDDAYPPRLAEVPDAPPVLFYRGRLSAPRRRVAMVGSRNVDHGFEPIAHRFAREVAREGVCIVSGAARGIDTRCHEGALEVNEVTWAFLGSALDEIDAGQADICWRIVRAGGMVFSELPPGVRADKSTFPMRNRLIAGAADAVVVLRAEEGSGSLHTVKAAKRYGRPVLALTADASKPGPAAACHRLIKEGDARLCDCPEDVWKAIGLEPRRTARPPPPGVTFDWGKVRPELRQAYDSLGVAPESFDDLLERTGIEPAALISALGELEWHGLAVQHPGKMYERV